ncbi:hypothetical protein [Sorangium cellulosum]|nr:hypothetical protein [Sorangium cellulosum]
MSTWTVWSNPERSEVALVRGEDPPRFADGTPMPDVEILLWKIEAATYEEAAAVHHLRMGWEPYRPVGDPEPCPRCSAMFYPDGSGECSCGHRAT